MNFGKLGAASKGWCALCGAKIGIKVTASRRVRVICKLAEIKGWNGIIKKCILHSFNGLGFICSLWVLNGVRPFLYT